MKAYQVTFHPPIAVHVDTSVPKLARLMTTHRLNSIDLMRPLANVE
jgi:hypothetical protein